MADRLEEVLNAIDRVIKDVDRKYDECLVEHFIESFDIDCPEINLRSPEILERLKFYFEHKSFLMLNQPRAFKILKTILPKPNTLHYAQEIENIIPLLDSLWKTLDTIVLNNNASAMAVMLDIFNHVIILSEQGLNWLLEREVTPPIQLSIPIEDISSLIRYTITKCNNYHTRNKAEKLLYTIIVKNSSHVGMTKFIQLVQKLISECLSVNVLMEAMSYQPQSLMENRYKINETIESSFMANIDKTNVDFNSLCKYLGLSNLPRKVILEKLRAKRKLDGIIHYVSSSALKDKQFDQLLISYVLYPLLAKFDDEETLSLVSRLMATRDERDFVEWNMNSKTPTLCIVQLKNIIEETIDSRMSWPFTIRTLNLIVPTLTNYIRCNYSLKCTGAQMKNMCECCRVLRLILETSPSDERILHKIFKIICNFLNGISYNDLTMTVVIQLLHVMLTANHFYARANDSFNNAPMSNVRQVSDNWLKTIKLAYTFRDSDLLNEFLEFFEDTELFLLDENDLERYVELVFKHIYEITKDSEHRELLGNLASVLITIDLSVNDRTFEKQNIQRYHDVPLIVSDILEQKSAIPSTIERVMTVFTKRSKCGPYLDCFSCSEVRERFSRALTSVIKGDSSEWARMQSLKLLNHMILLFIKEDERAEKVLEQLVATNILKTLHEVITGSLYSTSLYSEAMKEIGHVREKVISKVENLSEILIDDDLIDFYTSQEVYSRAIPSEDLYYEANEVRSSYVQDILNANPEKGISECY